MFMLRIRTSALITFSLFLAFNAESKNLKIQSSVDSRISKNGEPIRFTISVYLESHDTVLEPKLPLMTDWQILRKYSNPSYKTTIINGAVTFSQNNDYVYFLQPLRKGNINIPKAQVTVGGKIYDTDPITVAVKELNDDPIAKKFNNQGRMPAPLADPGTPDRINPNEDVIIQSEPSKTDVFLGELIVLPFYLYFKDIQMHNAEISKFPTFKNFLKEELFVPKTMTQNPVQVGDETFFRTELIRYALFPLKVGKLPLDSLIFKAEALVSPAKMIDDLAFGNPFEILENMGQSYPLTKSAKSIDILVKPLPTAPEDSHFTGGVGQFDMFVTAPDKAVRTGQPFSLTVKFQGRGNVKSIEAPVIKLPEGLESFETKTAMEFKEDATGFKTFEFLLLSRSPGQFNLDPFKWTYFDPDKRQYVNLDGPPLSIKVEGDAPQDINIAESPKNESDSVKLSPIHYESQKFISASNKDTFINSQAWTALGFAYAFLGVGFFIRRKKRLSDADYAKAPWKLTELKIIEKKTRPAPRLAHLLDQWTREWIVSKLDLSHQSIEDSRDNLIEALKKRLAPESYVELSKIRDYWAELDHLRFSGQNVKQELYCAEELKKAQTLFRALEKKFISLN